MCPPKWDKSLQKYPWIYFMLALYCWTWSLLLNITNIFCEIQLKKTKFSLESLCQLEIASSSVLGPCPIEPVQSLCLRPRSPWVHTCVTPPVSKDTVSLELPISFGSFILSASCSTQLLKSWGERLDEDIPFRVECSKISHSLHTAQLWVSVLTTVYYRRKLLWWWPSETLIYRYSWMSLRVISSMCLFSRTVVFGFLLGPWPT